MISSCSRYSDICDLIRNPPGGDEGQGIVDLIREILEAAGIPAECPIQPLEIDLPAIGPIDLPEAPPELAALVNVSQLPLLIN